MSIRVFKTIDELVHGVAGLFIETAEDAITRTGRFNVSLSGGSSPKKLYELLASPEFNKKADWSKIFFFFGDERYVPKDDPSYNGLMVKKALFAPLNIPDSQVFLVDTSLSPDLAAKAYAEVIESHFKGRPVQFDLVLLGLGDNAHTASLFPNTPVLYEEKATVKEVFLVDQQVYRITMTAPLINQASHIAFLVFGESKAEAVYQILYESLDVNRYPAQLIRPSDGNLDWFLDVGAADLIKA